MSAAIRDEIFAAISDVKSIDELGSAIVEKCADAFNAEVCTLWRCYRDEKGIDKLRLLAASAKAPQTLAQEITYVIRNDINGIDADGVTGYVAQTKREVHVASFGELQDKYSFCWQGRMDKTQWDGIPRQYFRSLSAFPLMLGQRLVGVLKLENKRGSNRGFPEADRQTVREMKADIALAVNFHILLDTYAERLIQVPAEMVAALLQPFEPQQLVSEIVKTVADSLHAEICSLWLVDPSRKELRMADGIGFPTEARREQTYHLSDSNEPDEKIDGITAWVAVRKRSFWANSWDDLKAHPSWRGKWDRAMWQDREQKFRCLYAAPLLRQDSIIGVLKVENRIGEAIFTATDRALCGIMASLIVLVLELGQQLRASVISEMAHLVRSPIGQVINNFDMVEREIKKFRLEGKLRPDRVEKYLNIIKKALLSAVMTSRELAAIFKSTEYLKVITRSDQVELTKLVEERITQIRPLLYNGIRIVEEISQDVKDCKVALDVTDSTRVRIAIDNILHNAIKYSNHGGVVRVSLSREDKRALLKIQDAGCGISKEDLHLIWEPNFSSRASDHPQSTGMGLTMVKQVFDRMGWEREVISSVNKGTTFKVKIPLPEED